MTCAFLNILCTCFKNVSNFLIFLCIFPVASCSLIIIESTLDRPASDIIDANIAPDFGITPDYNMPAVG